VDLTTALQLIMAASAVVSSAALVVLAYEVRKARLARVTPAGRRLGSSQAVGPVPPGGFAVYVYRNNRWELESDLSAPGFEPSPPTIPGAFEGHVVKKESRPSSER
jgi:hypothetical protein